MPPPGIPDWLYPGAILRSRVDPESLMWVEAVSLDAHGILNASLRLVRTLDPLRVVSVAADATSTEIVGRFDPVENMWATEPIWQVPPEEPFTQLPLTGFTRIADPGFEAYMGSAPDAEVHSPFDLIPEDSPDPPPAGTDAGLEVLSNHTLVDSVRAGVIRVASAPRISPLGGVTVFIMQDGSDERTFLGRADLGLPSLELRHDEVRGVRILTNRDIQNLRPSPWVAEATEALAAMAERRLVSNQTLLQSADVPQEENEENLNFYTPRTWADAPNFEAERANAEEEGLDTNFFLDPDTGYRLEVQLGTVMVARNNPDTRVGIVTRVDHEWSDGQNHTFVNVRLSEDGFYNGREVRVPLEGLLAQAIPAGNAFPPEAPQPYVQIFEVEGGVLAETDRFLAEHLRSNADPVRVAKVVGLKLEPPKPARTSFERLLEDDDD